MQVSSTNFRVPDVMVLRASQKVDCFVREAPLICMEVLSPEDTLSRMQQKIVEYVNFGVQYIWIFDPELRIAYHCDKDGFHRVNQSELTVPDTPICLPVADVFSVLD